MFGPSGPIQPVTVRRQKVMGTTPSGDLSTVTSDLPLTDAHTSQMSGQMTSELCEIGSPSGLSSS